MKKIWIILISIFGFIGLGVGLYFLEESYTDVILIGGENINTTVNEQFNDPGLDLYHNNRLIAKDKYVVKSENNVNTEILGDYKISYDVKYHLRKFHIERIVHVIDDIKPVITANIEKFERDYCTRKDKSKLTFEAIDNYDGDLTSVVEKNEVDNNIILSATDATGNKETLIIPIDYGTKPDDYIKLNGNSTIYVTLNGKYTESGAGYYDGCGKKLDEKITTSGSVDTKKTGTYTITYTASTGKKATRKIVVYKPSAGVVTGNGNGKIIYLTFDDGPGPYTQKILNTLDKYNVKATFFVTNQFSNYVYLIKNEYQAGHTVAVHTYTHNYNIYRSVDTYVNDFNKMNAVIEKYTGSKSKLFRFPGGSSNTVSRQYAKGVVRKIADYMNNAGYRYFDWDITSGDASNASRKQIYNNVVNGVKRCSSCIVLMHDIKATTANELDNILQTLTSSGYRFGTLSMSSPTAHHSIAN